MAYKHEWRHWFTSRGSYATAEDLFDEAKLDDVQPRRADEVNTRQSFYRGEPELTLLCFRWGGRNRLEGDEGELLGITSEYLWGILVGCEGVFSPGNWAGR